MTNKEQSSLARLVGQSIRTLHRGGFDRLFLYLIRYLSWRFRVHQYVRSLPNGFVNKIYPLAMSMNKQIIRSLHFNYPNKYTDANIYKYIWIDPSSVEYVSDASRCRGWVITEDLKSQRFMNRTVPKAIEQRFAENVEWKETVLAKKYTRSKFDERTESIDRLYCHIRDNGYRSQQQLLNENPESAWNGCNDAMHPLANEIAVDIGPDGEILWNMCGQHRLAIAKVLKIDQIPVQVFRRHREWQTVRAQIRCGHKIPVQLQNHPDLTDIK